MANYVKFQRGNFDAFKLLKENNNLDRNTLYFIENEDGSYSIYMGEKLVNSGAATVAGSLRDLEDVIFSATGANSFLVKNADDKWVTTSLEDVVALIQSKLEIDPTIVEDVTNLQNSVNDIVNDIQSLEESIAADLGVVNTELAKKANAEEVTTELAKKANAEEVNAALAKKANSDEVNTALNSKADVETVNAALAKKADVETVNAALNTKADAEDVYTKLEVNNKIATDISAAIAAANHLKRKVANTVEDIDLDAIDAEQYIYMVPTGLQAEDDKYDEYMVIDGIIEKVGSWEVNLNDYAKKTDLDTKVNVDINARLMALTEGEKLAGIEAGAQVNIINSISSDFAIDLENNKKLTLKQGYTLLSPDDQIKLSKLVIGEDDSLEVSGTVNADNVQGLEEWLNKNAGVIDGLSENNLDDELYTKLTSSMLITSIDTSELKVSNEGQLSILQVDKSKITGLESALNNKADKSVVDNLSVSINDISNSLGNYVLKATYEQDIAEIRDILTWKEME